MKPINLKTSLSKFTGQVIRVEASLALISKVRDDKPRTVLLKHITINGQIVTDHMWIPYSKAWDKFSSKHRNQKFTFKTKVITIKSYAFKKYRFGKITNLELLCDYRNPNKAKNETSLELINPDTANLLPLLPISQKITIEIEAIAKTIIETSQGHSLQLEHLQTSRKIQVSQMQAPLSEFQYNQIKNSLPCKITAHMAIKGDLFKVLPYQPVTATKLKNLQIQKEIS